MVVKMTRGLIESNRFFEEEGLEAEERSTGNEVEWME